MLKRAYDPQRNNNVFPQSEYLSKMKKIGKPRKSALREREHAEHAMLNVETPPHSQMSKEGNESDSDDDVESTQIGSNLVWHL
jgi:hypothetical protein